MKIKCPACSAVLQVDSSMSGQVVDCECGKKLRVPELKGSTDASAPSPDSRSGGLGTAGPAVDPSSNPPQSTAPSTAPSTGPRTGVEPPKQNPFTTTSSEVNPYAASNSPYGGTNQPVPVQTGGDQGLAIASLVLGICSLTLVCCGGFLIGIPAVICGVIAIKKANRGEATGKGMAIAGVTTGGISLGLFVAYLVLVILSELVG
ncbi:MAG: DUF4190 domain-containing protein [Rubripirellula sp.]